MKKTLKLQQILQLRAALLALNGRETAHEVNGKAVVTVKPYKLAGKVRKAIVRNLRVVEAEFQDFDKARTEKMAELAGGAGEEVPAEKLPELRREVEAMLAETQDLELSAITDDDLDYEANAIPFDVAAVIEDALGGEGEE